MSVQALKQRKHSSCSYAIGEFPKKIIFNSRGDDLAAAPKGTLNKQKSASAKFEVTPANCRLLFCGDTTLLGVSGVLLLHHRTKESVLFFPGIKRRGVGARVGDGPSVPWRCRGPSGDPLLVNIWCPVRSKMLQSEWDHCWLFILLEEMAPDDYFITLSCVFFHSSPSCTFILLVLADVWILVCSLNSC